MELRRTFGRRLVRAGQALLRRRAVLPGYDAAGSGRRLTGWDVTSQAISAIIGGSGDLLRNRARDIVRKHPFAEHALTSFTASAIGTGIKPRSLHPDPGIRETLQAEFRRWTRAADADGIVDFYGLQCLAARSLIEGGDCFVRLRNRRAGAAGMVPLQLQLLEGEMVPLHKTQAARGRNRIRSGIEFDARGKRVAYHIHRAHPGDINVFGASAETIRVPSANVLHLMKPLRPGQVRGVTWFASALMRLYEVDQYEDAELVRKKLAAMFTGFVTQPEADGADPILFGDKRSDDSRAENFGLEAGLFQRLAPGEELKFAETTELGQGFSDFMRSILLGVAAGIGVTYEQMTGDLVKVNYSSIRAGIIEFRKVCEQFQRTIFIHQFCLPVWERWLDQAALAGIIPVADLNRNRADYLDVAWVTPGWQWIDPKKEIEAMVKAIRAGLTSRADVVGMLGTDIDLLDAAILADQIRADELGLVFDSDARRGQAGPVVNNAAPPLAREGDADEGEPEDEDEEMEDVA